MSYSARCPQCGVRIEIEPEQIDRDFQCQECDHVFKAPVTGIMAGVTTDGFWVKRRVAGGAISEIFEAQKMATGQKVLLKVICPALTADPVALDAYLAWVERAREVDSPSFVATVETGQIIDHLYLAYPLVNGTCMDAYLETHGPMPEKEVLKTGIKIGRILDTAWTDHAALHLALKPSNILLDSDKQIFLLDPGHFRLLLPVEEPSLQRLSGWPPYGFAPEQITGQQDLDFRADMYALGAALYQMATGKPPFDGEDVPEVFGQHLQEPPPTASAVNAGLTKRFDELIKRLMAKNRDDRFANWGDAVSAMKQAMKGSQRKTTATRLNLVAPKHETGTGVNLNVGSQTSPPAAADTGGSKTALIVAGIVIVGILAIVVAVLAARLSASSTDDPPEVVAPAKAVNPELDAIVELYDKAVAYAAANPEDYEGAIKRFREVRTRGLGTDYQYKANDEIKRLVKAREAATPPPPEELPEVPPEEPAETP